jgi:hypothetical protein
MLGIAPAWARSWDSETKALLLDLANVSYVLRVGIADELQTKAHQPESAGQGTFQRHAAGPDVRWPRRHAGTDPRLDCYGLSGGKAGPCWPKSSRAWGGGVRLLLLRAGDHPCPNQVHAEKHRHCQHDDDDGSSDCGPPGRSAPEFLALADAGVMPVVLMRCGNRLFRPCQPLLLWDHVSK